MSKTKDDDYMMALLENINGKFDFLVEILAPMKKQTDKIPKIQEDIEEIKNDIKVIKFATMKTNQNIADHGKHLKHLETTFA